jgi:multiple PDZ domain protein
MPIFVKTVFAVGAAMEQGGLKRGDQILTVRGGAVQCSVQCSSVVQCCAVTMQVNTVSLEGLSHQEAVNILKNCEGIVVLQILS